MELRGVDSNHLHEVQSLGSCLVDDPESNAVGRAQGTPLASPAFLSRNGAVGPRGLEPLPRRLRAGCARHYATVPGALRREGRRRNHV